MLSKLVDFLKDKPFVLSAGIMRSGSTMVYNTLGQILLAKYGDGLVTGWQNDMVNPQVGDYYLIKTHDMSPFFEANPEHIFFTYRDLRTVEVSMNRFFNTPYSSGAIGYYILEYMRALKNNAVMIRYENLTQRPTETIAVIAKKLDIKVNPVDVYAKIMNIELPGHFTHTKDEEWRALIPEDTQKEITRDYSWWFEECGYPVE